MAKPRVVVVGLGPADQSLLTPQTQRVLDAAPCRVLRTTKHPAADAVGDAVSCDDLYESADVFDEVYRAIVERVHELALAHSYVVYAVPGSPLVLERSVEYLRADDRFEVELVAAMSFLDVAWAKLGIDPVDAGVRMIDGHRFSVEAAGESGPLLVAHCHNQRVLSDIKLAVDEPGETTVVVLQRLGLPDEAVFEVSWADLDRDVVADHLTSIYIPQLEAPVAGELMEFYALVQRLREECPWDREQTHLSLRRHLVEEAYEVVDAIDGFDPETGEGAEDLEEELGDLLFQVFIHAIIGAEEGWFQLADIAKGIHDKLYVRHPHVFGDAEVSGTEELLVHWEQRKVVEKGRASVLDGIARSLPALSLAEKTVKKADAIDSPLSDQLVDGLARALDRFVTEPTEETVGEALLAVSAAARRGGVDPEMSLRAAVAAVSEQIRAFEA